MRILRRSPGFVLTAATTLGAGIAAMVAMFSAYSRAVLNPITVPEPDRLITIYAANKRIRTVPAALSWPRFEFIRDGGAAFSHAVAYAEEGLTLNGVDDRPPEQLRGLYVSAGFFDMLRAAPARGRLFSPEDDVPNGPPVCVLSSELWQSRFGGREMVGEILRLNGRATQVVGIAPPRLTTPWADRQIFLPRPFEDDEFTPQTIRNGATYLEVAARLRPGATDRQAAQQVRAAADAYAVRFGGHADANTELEIRPLLATVVGKRGPAMRTLLGAVALTLLVACANTAALFLSRLAGRRREISVRQALGASRATIVGGLLRESLAIAAVAGIFGTLAAQGILTVAQAAFAPELPPGIQLTLDTPATIAALASVLLSAVLIGLLPALHITNPRRTSEITAFARGTSETTGTRRFRATLVVVEVAMSVCLMVGAALATASLARLEHTSPGFDPSGVAAGFATLPLDRYNTPERQSAFFYDVLDRLRGNAHIANAAVVFGLPFHDQNFAHTYAISGRPIPPLPDRPRAGLRIVTEDYFRVMRIRLLQGRNFTQADRAGAPGVCIVNESLARRQFAGASAIGQVIRRGRDADQLAEIVGVIADVKTNGLRVDTPDEIFYPFRQLPRAIAAIVARTTDDPATLARDFQSAISAVDPDQPLSRFDPMGRRLAGTFSTERLIASLTLAFAGLAALLASVGLYAVLAHGVATRTGEIGLRMAIGAAPADVLRLILREAARLVGIGIAAGVVSAAAGTRLLSSQLYGIDAHDPAVCAAACALFAAVGLAASLAPAIRASRLDPVRALQTR